MALKWKSKGNSSGKLKVYFCCHPDDFDALFEKISDAILEIRDCSVWYDENREVNILGASVEETLSSMNLMILPVTEILLRTKNRALEVELPFAIEPHIPVVPMLFHPELTDEFNRECGNLQCFDAKYFDTDDKEFKERLTRTLSPMLVTDETVDQIRNSFDAYVFLSYRKKDRLFVKDLINLIHRDERCRDIAVWYDDYLVPGEDFNESIREAMKKSSVFALLVTPNLVSEDNYVRKIEYPYAKKAEKIIVPAEFVYTDRAQLCSDFTDIPECIDAYNYEAWDTAFSDVVAKLNLKENDNSPEHLFYIGLAYLIGIDVEKDGELAERLLTRAAESGYPDGMKKLAEMYRTGNGVARDGQKAVYWIKKHILFFEAKYRKVEPSEKLTVEEHDAFLITDELIRDYLFLLELDSEDVKTEAEKVHIKEMCENIFIDRLGFSFAYIAFPNIKGFEILQDSDGKCHVGNAIYGTEYVNTSFMVDFDFHKVMEMCSVSIDDEICPENYSVFLKTVHRYEKMKGRMSEKEVLSGEEFVVRKLAKFSLKAGVYFSDVGNMEEAAKYCLSAIVNFSELLGGKWGKSDFMKYYEFDLAVAFEKLSEACLEIDGGVDNPYYKKALEVTENVSDKTRNLIGLRITASSYERLGKFRKDSGDFAAAENCYRKSLEIRRKVLKETKTPESENSVAFSYYKLGTLNNNYGLLGEAHTIWEGLSKRYPQNTTYEKRKNMAAKAMTDCLLRF